MEAGIVRQFRATTPPKPDTLSLVLGDSFRLAAAARGHDHPSIPDDGKAYRKSADRAGGPPLRGIGVAITLPVARRRGLETRSGAGRL